MEAAAAANEGQPNSETLWAILRKTGLILEETARRQEETDRMVKETAKQMKETDRRMGHLGDRFGEMIECMVMPNLLDKFHELGFVFTKAYPHASIKDAKNKIIAEVDITLENGDKVMLVEVMPEPSIKDVQDHLERMEKVRLHAALRGDSRKYLGAVAGMVINNNERDFALKNGFYVIEPSGETFTITPPEGSPREWQRAHCKQRAGLPPHPPSTFVSSTPRRSSPVQYGWESGSAVPPHER